MVTSQTISVSITKGEHTFTFHMPVGSTWANAVDAASEVFQHVGALARQSMEQYKPVEPEITEPTIVEGTIDGN